MSTTPQTRSIRYYRQRLVQRGMARFEVLALDADRELIPDARAATATEPARHDH